MRLIVIHSEYGDTVAAVVRTEELTAMGVAYTEIQPDCKLSEILKGNKDLYEDVDLLIDTYLSKRHFGMK